MVPVTVVPDVVMRSDFVVLCELVEEFRVCVLHDDGVLRKTFWKE